MGLSSKKEKEQEGYEEPFQGESLGGFATSGIGSGRSKGRGKEGTSQQLRGSETASQGRQMGEQVLYLPSSNSAEQSCHQTLKGVIKAAAKPISEHSFGSSSLHQSQRIPWPSQAICCAPSPWELGIWLLLGTAWGDDGSWSLQAPVGQALATWFVR